MKDELINVLLTEEDTDIIIGTKFGYAVRFNQSAVRGMSRIATGVRKVSITREGDTVVGQVVITDQDEVLSSLKKGYGKRTVATEYPTKAVVVKG